MRLLPEKFQRSNANRNIFLLLFDENQLCSRYFRKKRINNNKNKDYEI
jgi:hypothetical protein